MRAHAEHADREIRRGVDGSPPAEVWRRQQRLERSRQQRDRDPGELATLAEQVAAGQRRIGGPVFRVPRTALPELERHLEPLNRRASRLGCPPIAPQATSDVHDERCVYVVVAGEPPALLGWTLVAIVQHHPDGAAVRPVDRHGETLDPHAFAVARCDHCRLTRRRTKTYVVRHTTTGELRRVGSACLRDFLGGHDPARLCAHAERMTGARSALEHAPAAATTSSTHRPEVNDQATVPLAPFAAQAAHAIRTNGFRSRREARREQQPATVDLALDGLNRGAASPDKADRALANAALSWARALPRLKTVLSGFEREASRAAQNRRLGHREQGLISALIAVYRRQRARSRHLGVPGDTLQVPVLVAAVAANASARYPRLQRCDLLDAQANRLVWWQTSGRPLPPDEVVELHGRVLRHTHFGPTAVTVLSHCQQR